MEAFWQVVTLGCGMWGAVIVLCVGALALIFHRAPEGWEDREGFHYGRGR